VPHTDRPITSWERAVYRRVPAAQRAVRTAVYWQRELLASGMAKHPRQMALVRMVAARHLARQVPDPDLRKRLTPQYTPGCKRLVPSNDFYPALLQPQVELVTDPIERLTGRGVVTGPAPGRTHELDVLILATGFRVTDNPVMARIQGADGTRLADVWAPAGPKAFLATTVAGFPNLFLINGPNSATGHTSLLVMTEAQIPYIVGAIRALDERRIAALDLRADVQERYNRWLDGKLSRTVWNSGGCDSWYLHAHGRNSVLWPDYTWRFRRLLSRFDVRPYHQLGRSS